MNCVFCQKPIPQFRAACDACVLEIAREVEGDAKTPALASEAKIPLSDSDKAPGNAGSASEREARIHADVFNPNESDADYFLRRKRELGIQ